MNASLPTNLFAICGVSRQSPCSSGTFCCWAAHARCVNVQDLACANHQNQASQIGRRVSNSPATQQAAQAPPQLRVIAHALSIACAQAVGALNTATLIYGSQHTIIKDVVESSSPSSTNAARFAIAAVAALPFVPGAPWRRDGADDAQVSRTWRAGLELGGWSFLGFGLQAIGLQYTTASRSAFLLYLNVKLVPLIALICYGRQSPPRTWASAALALAGTLLLTNDGSPPNVGDAWSVAAAGASACFILRLEDLARCGGGGEGGDGEGGGGAGAGAGGAGAGGAGAGGAGAGGELSSSELNAATIVTSAVLCSLWALVEVYALPGGGGAERAAALTMSLSDHLPPLLYLALVTTFAAQWLQAVGQTVVSAADAAVLYALDPVYAAGFSFVLLGERLGLQGYTGAALVLAAVLLSRTGAAAAAAAAPAEAATASEGSSAAMVGGGDGSAPEGVDGGAGGAGEADTKHCTH